MSSPATCPGCHSRCPAEAVSCGRGEAIIRNSTGEEGGKSTFDTVPSFVAGLDTDGKLAMSVLMLGRIGHFVLEERAPVGQLLSILDGHGGWMTETELSKRLGPRARHADELLESAAEDGLLVRESVASGKTVPIARLTRKGSEEAKAGLARRDERARDAFKNFTEEEKASLRICRQIICSSS